jgi:hypothetical protein
VDTALTAESNGGAVQIEKSAASVTEAAEALEKTLKFTSGVSGAPEDKDEQRRITSRPARAAELCAEAIQCAASVAGEVALSRQTSAAQAGSKRGAARQGRPKPTPRSLCPQPSSARGRSRQCAGMLRIAHRSVTLGKVATGELTADDAIARRCSHP